MSWKDRKAARLENRANRREERRLRKEIRQANRTARQGNRAETRQTAYENGIDPNGWIADSVGHAAGAASDIWGGGKEGAIAEGKTAGTNQMVIYAIIGLVVYKMFGK